MRMEKRPMKRWIWHAKQRELSDREVGKGKKYGGEGFAVMISCEDKGRCKGSRCTAFTASRPNSNKAIPHGLELNQERIPFTQTYLVSMGCAPITGRPAWWCGGK